MKSVTWKDWAYLFASIAAYYLMTSESRDMSQWYVKVLWGVRKGSRLVAVTALEIDRAIMREIDRILETGRLT